MNNRAAPAATRKKFSLISNSGEEGFLPLGERVRRGDLEAVKEFMDNNDGALEAAVKTRF